jgi:hypothetical protein
MIKLLIMHFSFPCLIIRLEKEVPWIMGITALESSLTLLIVVFHSTPLWPLVNRPKSLSV